MSFSISAESVLCAFPSKRRIVLRFWIRGQRRTRGASAEARPKHEPFKLGNGRMGEIRFATFLVDARWRIGALASSGGKSDSAPNCLHFRKLGAEVPSKANLASHYVLSAASFDSGEARPTSRMPT